MECRKGLSKTEDELEVGGHIETGNETRSCNLYMKNTMAYLTCRRITMVSTFGSVCQFLKKHLKGSTVEEKNYNSHEQLFLGFIIASRGLSCYGSSQQKIVSWILLSAITIFQLLSKNRQKKKADDNKQ